MVRFALLFAVLASSPADAKCAMSHLRPTVVTTGGIIAGGGFLVATVQAPYDVKDEGEAAQPTWQVEAGGTKFLPTIDTLAPGLVVYRVPMAGDAVLLDGATVVAKLTATKGNPAPLAAPKVKAIRHDKRLGRRASAYTKVTLDGAPPAGAVALVLTDAKGTARSYGLVESDTEITVYAHARCGVVPNNTIESKSGDKVKVFWVDQSGRVSAPSKAITITGKTTNQDG
jgi:hypothetical protein